MLKARMFRIVAIVYLFSLANGLLLAGLERLFPERGSGTGAAPAEEPLVEAAGADALFAQLSVLVAAAGVAALGLVERLKHLRAD